MTLGIQKLNNTNKVTVPKPPFASSGMEKPVNQIGRMQLTAWGTESGDLTLGPGRPGNSLVNGASNSFTGKWGGIVITMWIRTASNRGGSILAFHRAVQGTDSGPQAAGTDSLDIQVGADGVSGGGSEWLFPLNQGNDGWHHIELRFGSPNELYVDGRFKTPTTSASLPTFTSGFDALHIGGKIVNFLQGVTDYTKNFEWDGGTQQFDIAQLAVYEGGVNLYPFYDLGAQTQSGNAGKALGTWTPPAANTQGGAHPYPIIYIPFDQNPVLQTDYNQVGGWGNATGSSTWYDIGEIAQYPDGFVPAYGGQITWYDTTGKTSGVIENGPISSGERLPPVNAVPYGSPASFTYNANRDAYYNINLSGSMNFWAYDDLSQDWIVSSEVYLNTTNNTIESPTDDYRTMSFSRDHSTGKILWNISNQGGPGIPNNGYNFEFNYTPSAGWNHYSFEFFSQGTDTRNKTARLYVNGVFASSSSLSTTYGNFTIFTVGGNIVFNGVSFQQLYIKRSAGRIDTRGRYVDFGSNAIADADSSVLAATSDLYERFTPTLTNFVEPNATAT